MICLRGRPLESGKYLVTIYERLPFQPNPGLKWKEIFDKASRVHVGISTETVSKYLAMLVKYGLVERTMGEDGRTRLYRRSDLTSLYLKKETLTAIQAEYESKLEGIDKKHVPAILAEELIRRRLVQIVGHLFSGLSFSLRRTNKEAARTSLRLLIEAQILPILERTIEAIYPNKYLRQLMINAAENYLSDIEYFR